MLYCRMCWSVVLRLNAVIVVQENPAFTIELGNSDVVLPDVLVLLVIHCFRFLPVVLHLNAVIVVQENPIFTIKHSSSQVGP